MLSQNISIKKLEKSQIIDNNFGKSLNKTIILESESDLKYLIISNGSNIDLQFISAGNTCNMQIYGIFFSKNNEQINGNISVQLQNDFCMANVYLLSLMGDNAIVNVKGDINIQKGVSGVSGHLLQENIILGEKIKVNTLPILNVASNDVSAGHGSRIQKLDSDKLFYMMSKGLSQSQSKKIILKGYIDYILQNFDLSDDDKTAIEIQILDYLF